MRSNLNHISLNVADEIKKILPVTLEKDLQDDEIICPVCHGIGILKQDYRFGVKEDDTEKAFKLNWYDNEYLTLCPNCYFGRIKTCKYCGKPLPKHTNRCSCDGYREQEAEEKRIKYQETIEKANEVDINELPKDTWFYDEQTDDYFSDIEGFVDSYKDYSEFENDEEKKELSSSDTESSVTYHVNGEQVDKETYEKAIEDIEDAYLDNIRDMLLGYCEVMDEVDEWRSRFLRW